jgi:hypothetical protein
VIKERRKGKKEEKGKKAGYFKHFMEVEQDKKPAKSKKKSTKGDKKGKPGYFMFLEKPEPNPLRQAGHWNTEDGKRNDFPAQERSQKANQLPKAHRWEDGKRNDTPVQGKNARNPLSEAGFWSDGKRHDGPIDKPSKPRREMEGKVPEIKRSQSAPQISRPAKKPAENQQKKSEDGKMNDTSSKTRILPPGPKPPRA